MYPHRIRLRGPWEYDVLPADSSPTTTMLHGRVNMPCTWHEAGLGEVSGRIRFTRHFGMPRSHDSGEHYWLVFESRCSSIQVTLNNQELGELIGDKLSSTEVTAFLQERNRLEVTVSPTTDQDSLIGEAALEIRRAAFLLRTKVERLPDGRLKASTELGGVATEGLELYLMADRRSLAYVQLPPTACNEVELLSDTPVSSETTEARVELIHGGAVWFQAECPIA